MTLCMAAVSYDADKKQQRIVFGSDKRAEVAWAGGDVAFKFGWARKEWAALIAGEISKARDFLATCRAFFEGNVELLTRDNIFDKFNDVSSAHKEKLCHRYVRQRLGISFERFLAQGESELPTEVRARVFHELGQLEYGCESLIFGFTKHTTPEGQTVHQPHIVEVDRYGEVTLHENFAAIGTGAVIANSTLYQREQSAYHPFEKTLYHLYEASRLAYTTAPSVGEISEFLFLDPPIDDNSIIQVGRSNPACLATMAKTFQAVGPKPVPWLAPLDANCFRLIEMMGAKRASQPLDSGKSEDQQ